MISLPITPSDIITAKAKIRAFDARKCHDKFINYSLSYKNNNYKGYLGEMLLHKYLDVKHIKHIWISKDYNNYIDTDKPDFIINNITFDIKTTTSECMWIQNVMSDIYIYAQIRDNMLHITSFITGEALVNNINKQIETGYKSPREDRIDYLIHPDDMLPIELLDLLI